jgi:hypothetical protein
VLPALATGKLVSLSNKVFITTSPGRASSG